MGKREPAEGSIYDKPVGVIEGRGDGLAADPDSVTVGVYLDSWLPVARATCGRAHRCVASRRRKDRPAFRRCTGPS